MTRRGFSLAEMMVAIGILGIGLTMVACFFPVALYQHGETTAQHRAMQIARQAKEFVLELQPVPPVMMPLALFDAAAYDPEHADGAMNVIWPPVHPDDPAFDEEVRYIWYPFAKPAGASNPNLVKYFLVVTRRLARQRFPSAVVGSPAYVKYPQFTFVQLAGVAGQRALVLAQPLLNWKLIEVVPPGSPIFSVASWARYTVVSATPGPPEGIQLREELLPEDAVAPLGVQFLIFPPPVEGGMLGEKSPYVMALYF